MLNIFCSTHLLLFIEHILCFESFSTEPHNKSVNGTSDGDVWLLYF